MKRAIFHLSPWLAAVAAIALTACKPPFREVPRTEPPPVILPASVLELTPEEVEKLIAATPGLVILDVRGEGEVQAEGKIAGAQLYDYLHGEDTFDRLQKLDRSGAYLLYCAVGGRAKLTAARMHEMGFGKLSLLKGGLNAWIAAGKPVEK